MVRERPVTHREFLRVLRHLGFEKSGRTSGSHEKWARTVGKRRYVVTVDKHHAPYHRRLLRLMLHQAGLTKREFFKLLDTT